MNTQGSYRCDHCKFASYTEAGLNTHYGKKHPTEKYQKQVRLERQWAEVSAKESAARRPRANN